MATSSPDAGPKYGWMCASWCSRTCQLSALPGSATPRPSTPVPFRRRASWEEYVGSAEGDRIVAVGGSPTVTVLVAGCDSRVPSDTRSVAV
jgi:hypothetical protein